MNKKNILIGMMVFVIAVLVLNTIEGWFTFSEPEKIANESKIEKPILPDVTFYTDAIDSSFHANFKATQGIDPKNYVTNKYYSYVSDTLAPALKIKMNEVRELTQIKAKLEDRLKAQQVQLDANKNKSYYYKTKYFEATANESDSTLRYSYNAELNLTKYDKKESLFSRKKTYIDISSPDKNMKINGVENFIKDISSPPTKFGVGVQAGYGLGADLKIQPYIGFGVSYNLIRF